MSTSGFRKVATFEETLAEARKDEQYRPGILSVGLQNHASRIINDPQFQRIQGRMQQDQEELTQRHIEEKAFQNNIQNLAVTARIPRADLDYLINNLQQPPPPPPPPAPTNDFAADRERLLVEIEQQRMEDAKRQKAEQTAMMARMELLASRSATPMQQIINQYHQAAPPAIAQPTLVQNITNNTITQQAQREGASVHHIYLKRQPESLEIASSSQSGNQPPPPPGAGAIAGGATGPYPVPTRPAAPLAPPSGLGRPPPPPGPPGVKTKSKDAKEAKRVEKIRAGKQPEEEVAATTGNRPASAPASGAERILAGKRGAEGSSQGRGLIPLQPGPRFAGVGNTLPSSAFVGPMGPGVPWGSIVGARGRLGAGQVMVKTANFQPFTGAAQRLDPELHQIATRRMREIGIAAEEARGGEAVRRMLAGKRREPEPNAPRSMLRAPMGLESQKRRRVGARPAGPQQFNIAT